jgi:hypothetical protein
LRLANDKDCLTVLDFVGNARPEYDFEHKFRALVGKTQTSTIKEIEDEFPHLPLGCSIILEKKAKEIILKNIREAIGFNRNQLIGKIRNFKHQFTIPLTLNNFLDVHQIDIQLIYKKGSWKRLCADAGVIPDFSEPNELELTRCIKKLLQCNSLSYLQFIQNVLSRNFQDNHPENELMSLMLHFDIWQNSSSKTGFTSLYDSFSTLFENPNLISEFTEIIKYLIDKIDFIEKDIDLGYNFPLKIHSRYNRDQILVALQLHKFEKASSNIEGVALNKELNTEAFFITLKKSEKEYSPTTLYDDYALSEYLFHWQSQNATYPESPKGQSYINHLEMEKKILLFVREQNKNEHGNTMSYVFLGLADFQQSSGAKPMNIEWKLKEPMPAYIWKESGKLAVG